MDQHSPVHLTEAELRVVLTTYEQFGSIGGADDLRHVLLTMGAMLSEEEASEHLQRVGFCGGTLSGNQFIAIFRALQLSSRGGVRTMLSSSFEVEQSFAALGGNADTSGAVDTAVLEQTCAAFSVQPDEGALRGRELTFRHFQALLHRPDGVEEDPTPRADARQLEGTMLDGSIHGDGDAWAEAADHLANPHTPRSQDSSEGWVHLSHQERLASIQAPHQHRVCKRAVEEVARRRARHRRPDSPSHSQRPVQRFADRDFAGSSASSVSSSDDLPWPPIRRPRPSSAPASASPSKRRSPAKPLVRPPLAALGTARDPQPRQGNPRCASASNGSLDPQMEYWLHHDVPRLNPDLWRRTQGRKAGPSEPQRRLLRLKRCRADELRLLADRLHVDPVTGRALPDPPLDVSMSSRDLPPQPPKRPQSAAPVFRNAYLRPWMDVCAARKMYPEVDERFLQTQKQHFTVSHLASPSAKVHSPTPPTSSALQSPFPEPHFCALQPEEPAPVSPSVLMEEAKRSYEALVAEFEAKFSLPSAPLPRAGADQPAMKDAPAADPSQTPTATYPPPDAGNAQSEADGATCGMEPLPSGEEAGGPTFLVEATQTSDPLGTAPSAESGPAASIQHRVEVSERREKLAGALPSAHPSSDDVTANTGDPGLQRSSSAASLPRRQPGEFPDPLLPTRPSSGAGVAQDSVELMPVELGGSTSRVVLGGAPVPREAAAEKQSGPAELPSTSDGDHAAQGMPAVVTEPSAADVMQELAAVVALVVDLAIKEASEATAATEPPISDIPIAVAPPKDPRVDAQSEENVMEKGLEGGGGGSISTVDAETPTETPTPATKGVDSVDLVSEPVAAVAAVDAEPAVQPLADIAVYSELTDLLALSGIAANLLCLDDLDDTPPASPHLMEPSPTSPLPAGPMPPDPSASSSTSSTTSSLRQLLVPEQNGTQRSPSPQRSPSSQRSRSPQQSCSPSPSPQRSPSSSSGAHSPRSPTLSTSSPASGRRFHSFSPPVRRGSFSGSSRGSSQSPQHQSQHRTHADRRQGSFGPSNHRRCGPPMLGSSSRDSSPPRSRSLQRSVCSSTASAASHLAGSWLSPAGSAAPTCDGSYAEDFEEDRAAMSTATLPAAPEGNILVVVTSGQPAPPVPAAADELARVGPTCSSAATAASPEPAVGEPAAPVVSGGGSLEGKEGDESEEAEEEEEEEEDGYEDEDEDEDSETSSVVLQQTAPLNTLKPPRHDDSAGDEDASTAEYSSDSSAGSP